MNTNFLRARAWMIAGLLIAPLGTLSAQDYRDVQFASTTEMSDIYARLANLESRVASGNVNYGSASTGGCTSCCNDCCGNSGFIGGAELVWLKPYHSEDDFGAFDYDVGYRAWAGWQAAGGLGAQIRIFDYFQRSSIDPSQVVDITATDFEVYDAVRLGCNWALNIGGGLRYLDYLTINNDGERGAITGVGPVISAQLVRFVGDRGALYVIARDAIIVGDDTDNDDITTNVFEIQVGGQVQREWNGALLFARIGWEAQYYTDDLEGDSEGISLMGGVIGVGLMR